MQYGVFCIIIQTKRRKFRRPAVEKQEKDIKRENSAFKFAGCSLFARDENLFDDCQSSCRIHRVYFQYYGLEIIQLGHHRLT